MPRHVSYCSYGRHPATRGHGGRQVEELLEDSKSSMLLSARFVHFYPIFQGTTSRHKLVKEALQMAAQEQDD